MRVIKKSEVRKIIIGHVELTLIFLFDYLLCKIAILESLKVLFLDKKQKLLSVDGNLKHHKMKDNGVNNDYILQHIGTECPLSGPKFSSAETGMGVTSRP